MEYYNRENMANDYEKLVDERDRLKDEVKQLRAELNEYKTGRDRMLQDKFGFPNHRLMRYQIAMIKRAVEYILANDSLEGMKDE